MLFAYIIISFVNVFLHIVRSIAVIKSSKFAASGCYRSAGNYQFYRLLCRYVVLRKVYEKREQAVSLARKLL